MTINFKGDIKIKSFISDNCASVKRQKSLVKSLSVQSEKVHLTCDIINNVFFLLKPNQYSLMGPTFQCFYCITGRRKDERTIIFGDMGVKQV